MKITVNQLRKIIKEEVALVTRTIKSRRSLSEMGATVPRQPKKYLLDLTDCSVRAEDMGMSIDDFLNHIMAIGSKYPSIVFEAPNAYDDSPYSEEYDSLPAIGSKSDLTKFARELDQEFMGGAQSIEEEGSLVNAIEPF